MNSASSANSTISSKRRSTCLRVRPSMIALITTFSRPEISGWKPAPSSISAETRPSTCNLPRVGRVMPATSLSSVDLLEGGEGLAGVEVGEEAAGEQRALQRAQLVALGVAALQLGYALGHDGRP